MADGKVLLEVVVEGKNVKVVQREVEGVTDAVNENTTAQRRNSKATSESAKVNEHYDRGLKGVHQTNLSGAKSFSKIRDVVGGSSGLVGAYATLAANLFAATAAFTALQKAAQVEQLTQGLSALGTASGLAMGTLAKGLQESTGYAITLSDAMRQVAMTTSAGFDPSIIERLGTVAKNTSIALGRDMQDSMNRLVKGATKLEPELLDELGIMVRIDEASREYAKQMGKSASELTNFEKRQAFMNAVLAEGERKFGAIGDSVDPNPYDKLSATIQELSTTVLNFANILLGPLAGALASSKMALAGIVLIISKGVINQALPYFSMLAQAASKAAQQYSASWSAASREAMANVSKARAEIAASDTKGLNKRQSLAFSRLTAGTATRDEGAALQKSVEDRINKLQARQSGGWKKEGDAINALSKQNIARYEKELALLQTKLGLIQNINAAEAANAIAQTGTAVSKEASDFAKTIEEASNAFDDSGGLEAVTAFGDGLKKVTLGGVQYIKGMTAATGATTRFTGVLRIGRMALTAFGATATAVGRVVSFAFKGLLAAIPYIGMVMLAVEVLTGIWNKLVDAFKSDATKNLEKSLEDTSSTFEELKKNSEEVTKSLSGASSSITTFAQRTEAQANIISQLKNEYTALAAAQREAGGDGEAFIKLTDEQIQKNALLKASFMKEFKVSSFKDLVDKEGLDNASIAVEKFLKTQDILFSNQNALNKTITESNAAFSEYSNSFTNSSPLLKYATALDQIKIAAAKTDDSTGGLSRALRGLSEEQLRYLGLSAKEVDSLEEREAVLDRAKAGQGKLLEIQQQLNDAQSRVAAQGGRTDAEYYNQIVSAAEKANEVLKGQGLDTIEFNLAFNDDLMKQDVEKLDKFIKRFGGDAGFFGNIKNKIIEQLGGVKKAVEGAASKRSLLAEQQLALTDAVALTGKEIDTLQNKYKDFGIASSAEINKLISKKGELARTEIDLLKNKIKDAESLIKPEEEDNTPGMKQRRADLKILQEELRARENSYNTLFGVEGEMIQKRQEEVKVLETVTSELSNQIALQQKIASYAKEASEARQKIRESRARLADFRAGGTGELSAQKQYELQVKANADRKIALAQERDAKILTLRLEKDLLQKRFEISLLELAVIQSSDGFKDLAPELQALVNSQIDSNMVYTKAVKDYQGNITQAAKVEFKKASNISDEVYAAGVNAANLSYRAEIVADEVTLEEKKRAREVAAREAQVTFINEQLNAENTINDIYNRINSARTSILDNERRVRENELKALNLRNTGKYELTAQQTLDMEIEYASRREALIKEEETRKLKIIDLEYQLLDAQTRVQQITLAETMKKLADQEKEKAAAAANAGDSKAATKFNANAKDIEDSAEKLDAQFTNLINKVIPQARIAAGEAVTAETNASLSDLGAGVLSALQNSLNSFNPVITATVETNIVEIGQKFDASGLVQATAGAANAIIQNTVLTAKSKLDELGGDSATGLRADALRTVLELEDKIATKRKQLNEMTPEDRSKAMKDTGAGSLSDLIAQQEKAAQSDPFTKMRAGAAALQTVMAPMIESLRSLGPQGELVAAIAQGSVVMADSFTTLADSTKSSADKFAAVGSIVASVSAIVASAGNARIANIDREINAEKKRDGKSKESLQRIAALEKKKEAVAKKNFEMNKKMQMAQVVISAAATIAGILGNEAPKLGVAAVPLAFAVGGLALAQLAVIAGTSYEGGGSGGGASGPSSISVGDRRSTIDLAKSQSAAGELGYLQGDKGVGGPENFRPAFIGSRAAGGRVNAGYMVGEQGPELFVPKVPGRIVPSDKINNAPAQNVNISISALDAAGVEDVLTRQRGNIIGMIREAANSYGEKFLETVDTTVYTQPSKGYGVARA